MSSRHRFPRLRGTGEHGAENFGRRHLVAEPVAAQQQGGVGFENSASDLDEAGVVGSVRFRTHVAVDFIAARMRHGVALAQLARVLALADGRVVVRQLVDLAAANLVEPGVAHVPDGEVALLHQRQREHAGHSLPLRVGARDIEYFVVGDGDGFADALLGGAGLPLQAAPDARLRNRRRLLARRLPAHAVDHQEDAAVHVVVDAVLVILADQARVAVGGADQFRSDHFA